MLDKLQFLLVKCNLLSSMSLPSPSNEDSDVDATDQDYSTRLDEILSDEDEEHGDTSSDSDVFLYEGVDAEPAGDYREQLSQILEQSVEDLDQYDIERHAKEQDAPGSGTDSQVTAEIAPVCYKLNISFLQAYIS